jgi:hypothetical protein
MVFIKMENVRKTSKYISIYVASFLVVISIITVLINPLWRPREIVQEQMLKLIPIGTHIDDVIGVIESRKKWKVLRAGGWRAWSSSDEAFINDTINRKTISLLLGKYGPPLLVTFVGATLRFDEDLKLISIEVTKSVDVI